MTAGGNGSCPACGKICEKVFGNWWPHKPGDLANCNGGNLDRL